MKKGIPAALGLALIVFLPAPAGAAAPADLAKQKCDQADILLRVGNPEAAEPLLVAAAQEYSRGRDFNDAVWMKIKLAGVYQSLGRADLARDTYNEAQEAKLPAKKDDAMLAAIRNGLGSLAILSSRADADNAETLLKKSYDLAIADHDPVMAAEAANNLGTLYTYQHNNADAEKQYDRARQLAETAGMPEAECRAWGNLARVELDEGEFDKARKSCEAVTSRGENLPDSHDKAFLLLGAGDTLNKLYFDSPAHQDALRLKAFEAYQAAAGSAERLGDKRSESYALGYEGELYEEEKRYDESLALTRRALFLAQQIESPDILYQWEWQVGRLLRAQGKPDAAIEAYDRAVTTLKTIRTDVEQHYGNARAGSSFRKVAGDLYSQLSDLLLQKADRVKDEAGKQDCFKEAMDTTEVLKSAELEDYFQDQCVNVLKSRQKEVGSISPTAAVIYIIPLPDRTEILVTSGTTGKIDRVKSSVTEPELTQLCDDFRGNLEKRSTDEYLEQADALYADLIKPEEPLLESHHIDTLVFVPDGALRTIPMAALRDGHKFLIQKYAIAVTPGLTLMQASPRAGNVGLVMNALSQGVQGFPPLDHVPEEAKNVMAMYGGKALMNGDFNKKAFKQEFAGTNYSIVHIASHGHFDSDSRKTFVLTFDDKLHLDDLETLLRPSQIKDKPVELLTLSACETAAGDDRAALGLAGVAIKAGARSAFASLWCVNDEASSVLVSDFYAGLKVTTKARALQHAQCKLIAEPQYSHPCYWAPYLLIGNWL